MLPVDELVPHPIVGQREEILVGHPDAVLGALHRVVLAHEPDYKPVVQHGGQCCGEAIGAESLRFLDGGSRWPKTGAQNRDLTDRLVSQEMLSAEMDPGVFFVFIGSSCSS